MTILLDNSTVRSNVLPIMIHEENLRITLFFREEHFKENTFLGGNTLRKHIFMGEHFRKNTFLDENTLRITLF